jgi:hypothetical protein
MRPRFFLITVALATAMTAAALAVSIAQPSTLGGTGVGANNPAVTGSGVRNNPGAGANASIDNEQAVAPAVRDPGSAIELKLPLPAGNDVPQLGTPPSSDERKR